MIVAGREEMDVSTSVASVTERLLRREGVLAESFVFTTRQGRRDRFSQFIGLTEDMRRFENVLRTVRPDLVHLIGTGASAAPSYAEKCTLAGVPVIWSLTDFGLLCPGGNCRSERGDVCEECLHGRPQFVGRGCAGRGMDSFLSLVHTLYWNVRRLQKNVTLFLASTSFMRSKMLEAGFCAGGVGVLFSPAEEMPGRDGEISDAFCYYGPLEAESGVETLAEAAAIAGVPVVIGGHGSLYPRLAAISSRNSNITLLPEDSAETAATLARKSRCVVVPSESFLQGEDLVKTALCSGAPVIASDIAGLPEMVSEADGVIFAPGNTEELAAVLRDFDRRHAFDRRAIAGRAASRYTESAYLKNLLKIYADYR